MSANGRWFAVGFEDGSVWLIDLEAAGPAPHVSKLPGSGEPVAEVGFAAEDQRLLVTDRHLATRDELDRTFRVYSVPASDEPPALSVGDGELFDRLVISPERTVDRDSWRPRAGHPSLGSDRASGVAAGSAGRNRAPCRAWFRT